MSVAHIGKLQENTTALCKISAKLSGLALSADPDMSDQGSWNALLSHPDMSVGCETSGEGGTSPGQNSGCGISGWKMLAEQNSRCENFRPGGKKRAIWINSIWIPQAGTRRLRTSQTRTIAYPIRTRHSRSSHPDDGISYPDMSGSLTKVHKPCYIIPIACHNPRFVALRWCVRMPILLAFWICLWQRTSKLLFFMF